MTIGFRQNNPGNLKDFGLNYLGEIPSDNEFLSFSSMPYGIRAWLMDLHADVVKHGYKSYRERIESYAPRSENPTDSYLNHVGQYFDIDSPIKLDFDSVSLLFQAQTEVELGNDADLIKASDFRQGFDLFNKSVPGFFLSSVAPRRNFFVILIIILIIYGIYFRNNRWLRS